MRSLLTPHDVKQLNELYRQIPGTAWTANNRLIIPAGQQALEGADLQRFLEAHDRLIRIIDQMRAVLG